MRRGAALAPLRYPKVLGLALQTGGALLLRRAGEWGRFHKKPIFMKGGYVRSGVLGVRMDIDDSRVVVRFQRLITEMLVEKRLGHRRPELTDELYQTWREVEQRGLKESPEYRDVLLRADRHAFWLAGLVRLAARPVSSAETARIDTVDAQKAA
jgi:hypothetical protein